MKRYSVNKSVTSVVGDSALGIFASTTVRPRVYEIFFGVRGTPADNASVFLFQRVSTAGTATGAVTPTPLDDQDPVAVATAGHTYTAEPTPGAELLRFAANARATPRWVAAPGSELIIAKAANAGGTLFLEASTSAPTIDASILFAE